jgi:hypothetical protein
MVTIEQRRHWSHEPFHIFRSATTIQYLSYGQEFEAPPNFDLHWEGLETLILHTPVWSNLGWCTLLTSLSLAHSREFMNQNGIMNHLGGSPALTMVLPLLRSLTFQFGVPKLTSSLLVLPALEEITLVDILEEAGEYLELTSLIQRSKCSDTIRKVVHLSNLTDRTFSPFLHWLRSLPQLETLEVQARLKNLYRVLVNSLDTNILPSLGELTVRVVHDGTPLILQFPWLMNQTGQRLDGAEEQRRKEAVTYFDEFMRGMVEESRFPVFRIYRPSCGLLYAKD